MRSPSSPWATVLLLAAACSTPPAPEDACEVRIENASGEPLSLLEARRDGWSAARPLGTAATIRLALPPGRYAVQLGDSDRRIPLPLPAAGLGHEPPASLALAVEPWPRPLDGFCWIPAGPGLRGDELGVGQEDERPLATPGTAGFWLAARETTNAQYARFLTAIGRDRIDAGWLDLGGPQCRVRWDETARTFSTDAPELPAVKVSHAGALAYCAHLTRTTGVVHRLPTETEWEKAARGPGSRVYAYGDTCTTAAANQESGRLRAVGSFAPNGFGLFDMTGNAFEWTADVYRRTAYAEAPAFAQATNDAAATTRDLRVLRGGSFVLDGIFVRNSMRMRLRPDVLADDVGFRVLREVSDPTPPIVRGEP